MRKTLLFVGILFMLFSLLSIIPYISDYEVLSEYGKGFIVGKFLLMLVGLLMVIIGIKKTAPRKNVQKDK